jgi:hypothetical protein
MHMQMNMKMKMKLHMHMQDTKGLSQHLLTCYLPDLNARRLLSPPVQGALDTQVMYLGDVLSEEQSCNE